MDLKSAQIEEGYTMDAVVSRQVEINHVVILLDYHNSFLNKRCTELFSTLLLSSDFFFLWFAGPSNGCEG